MQIRVPNIDIDKPGRTNGGRIRAMTDEELADWLSELIPYSIGCSACIHKGEPCPPSSCNQSRLAWLRQPEGE